MESTNNSGLMRKTKTQLIEIIERKDDVEKKILAREKKAQENYEITNKQLEAACNELSITKEDLRKTKVHLSYLEKEIDNSKKVNSVIVSERDKAEREVSQHQETIDVLMIDKVENASTIKRYKTFTWCLTIALIAALIVAVVC